MKPVLMKHLHLFRVIVYVKNGIGITCQSNEMSQKRDAEKHCWILLQIHVALKIESQVVLH